VTGKTFVLDTSALLAFVQNEAGAERVERILNSARERECAAYISFVTLAELYYVAWQKAGRSAALELVVHVKALPLTVVESAERVTLLAGSIKANHRVSLADAFIAATASHVGGILVHKDPEFEQVSNIISAEELPYKTSKH
jgi:predicted nucleic acid-binding protein